MKKTLTIISIALVAILLCATFASCASPAEKEVEGAPLSYISLRINPEIEMIADENGTVLSADAVNEDGEVVLSTITLEGLTVEEAGVVFTDTAAELGYFDPESEKDTVYIDVEGAVSEVVTNIEEKIQKNIGKYFENKGVNGKVSKETLNNYLEKAEEWKLSAGHAKLVMRALDANPELTDTELIEMEIGDLLKLIKGEKSAEKIAFALREEYREEIKSFKAENAKVFELREKFEELEGQLKGELNEEEAEAIKAQIEEARAELEPLEKEYKEKLDGIKESFKENSKEMRKSYREEAENRRQEHKNKIEKGEKNKGEIGDKLPPEAPEGGEFLPEKPEEGALPTKRPEKPEDIEINAEEIKEGLTEETTEE